MLSKNRYECFAEDCDEKFKNLGQRIIHIDAKHGGRIPCPHENCKSILKASSFYNHMSQSHEKGEKYKPCEHCNTLISRLNMTTHVKRCTNNGEKKFSCKVQGCKSMFTTSRKSSVQRA